MRNNLSCSSSILAAGWELDRSEQSRQGGAWDGLSKPREAEAGSGVGGHALGGPHQLDLDVQEEPGQKLFEVFHIGRVCEGRLHNYPLVTQIWDSIQAGICVRWIRAKY